MAKKSKNKTKRTQLYFILAALACFLIVFGIILFNILGNKNKDKNVSPIDDETTVIQTEIQYVYDKPTDINGNLADKSIAINYGNSNSNSSYIEYVLEFKDKVLYKSDRLAPGDIIGTVKVDFPAEMMVGQYSVTVTVNNYNNKNSAEPDTAITKTVKLNIK